MDFLKYIQHAGPFTAPLCIAMGIAVKWLLSDRKMWIERCTAAEQDATKLREKRTNDLVKQAEEYAQIREAMGALMREWTAKITAAMDLLRRQDGAE